MTKKNKWTEEEMEVLRTMYHAGEKHKDIARILNRSEGAVQQRASMIGLTGSRNRRKYVSDTLTSGGVVEDLDEISFGAAPNTPWWKRMLGIGG